MHSALGEILTDIRPIRNFMKENTLHTPSEIIFSLLQHKMKYDVIQRYSSNLTKISCYLSVMHSKAHELNQRKQTGLKLERQMFTLGL